MQIYEAETKNGRIFRVAIENQSQKKRFLAAIAKKDKNSYEAFIRVEPVSNGIHNIKDFETLANSLQ